MILDTFGKRLRALRLDRDLSQIDLRDRMVKEGKPIGETYISELERTPRMPSLEVAAAMARVLDISLDYLGLLIEDAVSYKRQPAPVYWSEEADEIAAIVDALSPDDRAQLLQQARSFADTAHKRRENEAEALAVLDSVERDYGRGVRHTVERLLRGHGILHDKTARRNNAG